MVLEFLFYVYVQSFSLHLSHYVKLVHRATQYGVHIKVLKLNEMLETT